MSQHAHHTVWVLGAGFSRSLGGPLLDDFFSPGLQPTIDIAAQQLKVRDAEALVTLQSIYSGNQLLKRGEKPPFRPWSDPEQFISLLEDAENSPNSNAARLLAQCGVAADTHGRYARAARAYITLATDHFVPREFADISGRESWQPYVRWASRVRQAGDVVVTFNYDRVVELASRQEIESLPPNFDHRSAEKPWLLKLHGSVDWYITPAGNIAPAHPDRGIDVLNAGSDPAIGVPGHAKYERARKDFSSLWTQACAELKLARRVVFIGFRFPQGDGSARDKLLGAIAQNTHPAFETHIVLGPDVRDPQVLRVHKLIEWPLRGRTLAGLQGSVYAQPLYAEDFIALYDW
jgi:hypothetical protein